MPLIFNYTYLRWRSMAQLYCIDPFMISRMNKQNASRCQCDSLWFALFRASLFLFRCIFIASRLNYGAEWIFAWRGVPDLHCPFACSLCSEQPSQNWSRQEESGCFIEAQCWPQKMLARCDFCPLLWMSKRLDPNSKQARVNDGICYDSLTGWMVLV